MSLEHKILGGIGEGRVIQVQRKQLKKKEKKV